MSILILSADDNYLGLEGVTQGLARATSHRVLSPPRGSTPVGSIFCISKFLNLIDDFQRYSVPFFQNIGQDLRLSDKVLQCKHLFTPSACDNDQTKRLPAGSVPPEVLQLRDSRGDVGATDCTQHTLSIVSHFRV